MRAHWPRTVVAGRDRVAPTGHDAWDGDANAGHEHRDGIEDCPLTSARLSSSQAAPSRRSGARDAGLSRPTPRWDGTGHVVSPRNPRHNRPSRPRLLPSRNDPGHGLKSGTGHERRDWDGIDSDGTPRISVRTSRLCLESRVCQKVGDRSAHEDPERDARDGCGATNCESLLPFRQGRMAVRTAQREPPGPVDENAS